CIVIGVIVFGVMFYVMFKFCKFKGVVVVIFSYNIKVEVIWMVILVIILVVMVWLVMVNLIKFYDTCDLEMIVKVIGY
ncbi:cytochrome c oxidase subunit II, partial [Escherichia coli]|nr:cytochrome c oxidase subunit II [Escherichia coli]